MNIIFMRFKTKKYIGLFMAFITLIGTTSIPVSAVDTDTEHPVISVQRTFLPAMPRHDYLISVDAEDNKGIEEVTITYTIFGKNTASEGKTFSDQQMTKNNTNGRYEYNIPGEQISYLTGGFTFYITATDVNSLRVTTESLSVSITESVNATTVTPSSYFENPRVYGVPAAEIFSIDGYINNDTEYPVIIVPTYFSPARPGYDYRISVIAQDNNGIQKVTVDYKMGEKSFNTREMTKSTINGRYEYKIPYTELSPHGSNFNFTITATNMAGLKTTTDGSSNVYINARPNHVPKVDDYKVTVFTHTGNSNANNYTENPYDKPVPLPQNSEDDHMDKTYVESAPVTIKDVLALKSGTENITVTGQIAYFAKEYANPVIQSVIDGIPYSLYIYGATPTDAKIGDQVKLTGTYSIERGFPMLKLITAREIIGSDTPMAPEILTVEDLNTKGLDMLGRFIKVKSVKLGAYNAYGVTEITDATGTINIYKAAAFSTLVKEGDVVDLYATVGCVDSTVQLYTGTKEANGYTIYETITDTTPPTITVPDYYKEVRTSNLPFIIPAIVKDNKGIQKVTVTYTIGDKTVYDQPMYERSEELNDKTEAGNNYAYIIPDDQILETAPSFTFTVTATDVTGLQTVSEPSTVSIIHNYHITVGPPSSADDHTQLKPATTTQDNNTDNNTDDYTDNTHVTTITSTIKDVLALESDTENIAVTGQIAYFATNYAHPVIQAIIDGTPYSLYIYGSAPADAKIGDQVKLTGTYSIQNGLPMLRAITAREIVGSSTQVAPETVTISDLKTNGLNMLGRFIKIKDVTLGTYRAFGLTEISDVTGNMNIYKAAAFPTLVEAGDKVELYATVACDGSTVQLNTGTKEANTYNVYDTINDTKPPLVIVPDNLAEAQTSQDYFISVTAKDNKDIQDVTITYTIGDKTVSDQQMTQNTYNGNYDYRIPHDHLLATVPNFTFTVTATDVSGLKTISKISTITINDNLKITTLSPSPDTSMDFKTLPIGVTFINGGASPKITYTLKNNGETIITDKKIPVRSAGIAFDELGPLPVGNYTATVKIVRSEDGTTMSREWHFTVSE